MLLSLWWQWCAYLDCPAAAAAVVAVIPTVNGSDDTIVEESSIHVSMIAVVAGAGAVVVDRC